MTAAACLVAALVAVPAAFADHGSSRGDDDATVTTVTTSSGDDGGRATEPSDAADQVAEPGDDAIEAQSGPASAVETEDVQAPPTAAVTFPSGLSKKRGSGGTESGKSRRHRHRR
jgi:hypothetical protein